MMDELTELRDFVENLSAPLHWVGPDGILIWANQAELDLLGYTRDEYIGRHIADFHVDRPAIEDLLTRLTRNERLHGYPARLRHKDGSIRHVLISSSVFRRDGEFVHTRCLTIDVTEQRRTEENRRRAERGSALQTTVTHILSEATTLENAAQPILRALGAAGDWSFGALWVVDEVMACIRNMDVWHSTAFQPSDFVRATRETVLARGAGIPGRVWSAGTPLWIDDVVADPNFPRLPHALKNGLRAVCAFPVRVRGEICAVFEFFSRDARPADHETLRLLAAVGAQIGQFMERRQVVDVRARLAAIVDSSDDAIISKTLDGVITSWNRGAQDMFGYTADEAIGQGIYLIIPPERHAEEDDVLSRLRRGEKIEHFETERVAKGGRRLSISLSVSPIRNEEGVIVGAAKVARDITERSRADDEKARLYVEAAQALQARDDFLSMAAHELRNPLNALQLQLVSLRRAAERRTGELAREWVCDRVGQAIDEVARLVRLVSELMDVSRINAGQIDFELETVDFKQVIDAAMRRFEPQVRRGQIVVDAASVIGQWDPLRLDQIVTNLVSNAVKYGDGKPVEVRLTSADGQAVLEVRDRGIGIDPEQQQLLFKRFERLEARRMYGGFGLGLWITRRIVDAMGGAIEVQSERGRGSVFRVSVPMESVRETAV